ncbi:MAG: DUF1178 family protein [Candidatus Adiutrix sp.]|jgi:hypothetical protein|nr:DUF1178 family protein [Candidatus Adiutrix sp.]
MVIYDLMCSQGHHFEGWFQDLDDLSAQLEQKLLACPICADENISRLPSTFGLVKSGRPEPPAAPQPEAAAGQAREFMRRWEDFSHKLDREFDDVGAGFADEALKMHYGVSERRNIRGMSTEGQDEMLRKEGVEFFKFPVLSRKNTSPGGN